MGAGTLPPHSLAWAFVCSSARSWSSGTPAALLGHAATILCAGAWRRAAIGQRVGARGRARPSGHVENARSKLAASASLDYNSPHEFLLARVAFVRAPRQ